ncbi:MAG: META domain-containing protein, partial [Cycloclasticus sp.]|nr:META domain-containing protein [Cycloclasticus sp.]
MKIKRKSQSNPVIIGAIASTMLMTAAPLAQAEESLLSALTSGKASYSARLRYENVDQDNLPEEA